MKIIVAVDENWGIGCNGDLLIKIPEDMAFFRQTTAGKIVVMGHCTFKSLPKAQPLKGRTNIILSKDPALEIAGARVCHSLDELLLECGQYASDDIYVMGGQTIYDQMLPYCDTAYVTKLWPSPKRPDRYFPNLDEASHWSLARQSETKEFGGICYAFCCYVNGDVRSLQ